ncbi:glycosyltransferase family 2 protein [Mobilicoccus massiliensis]|uniref:glycosyltransferase family 2 protein n=1 Tax=Mobilicoccus massiliensis TaxID=1522310 RepID=UPI00058F59CA|nr:glycosyltransferase family 2 protein [Mobilicoccus massiliensis]
MSQPHVSVLMPVLNEEAGVAGAIASALAQAEHGVDLEVLVMNGPSTDATAEIVADIASRDPRVRLLDNPASIIPAGLNVGLREARGEFVARIDGHAAVSDDYIARALGHLRRDSGLAAVGGIRLGVARTPKGRAVALALSSPFGVGNSINHFGTEFCETDHASFGVYRTGVARDVGGWDETLLVNEDVDFDHRILARGHRIAFDPEMAIYWHVRENVPDLFRQYRRYGRGKAAMVRKNGRAGMRLRHLAAPTAVVGTAALAALATRRPRLAAAAYSPYLLGVTAAGVDVWRQRGDLANDPRASGRHTDQPPTVDAASLPAAFMAMHYAWGLGFLEGLLLRRPPAQSSARLPKTG